MKADKSGEFLAFHLAVIVDTLPVLLVPDEKEESLATLRMCIPAYGCSAVEPFAM